MKKWLMIVVWLLSVCGMSAQRGCGSVNTAFRAGEELDFTLYFNWKFIWVKVGTAQFSIHEDRYEGERVYRTDMLTRGTSMADKYFRMRDTLVAYNGWEDLVPLYYVKDAEEGKHVYHETLKYSYPKGKARVEMRYQRDGAKVKEQVHESVHCAYDMLSMLLRARSFDPAKMKVGERHSFYMAEGKRVKWQTLAFGGRKVVKVRGTGERFRCLIFSYIEEKEGEEKEVVRFYVSDDLNHLPVRLDLNLNFGSAKVFLTHYRGLRNRMAAKVK